jgi:hypothetical protein
MIRFALTLACAASLGAADLVIFASIPRSVGYRRASEW